MRLLLENGVDVNAAAGPAFGKIVFGTIVDPTRARRVDRGGFTALMGVADSGNPEAVKLLLDRNADPNAKLGSGFTPLLLASPTCQPEIVKMLVDKGANVNAREYRGATPLIRVAASDCLNAAESARILIHAGADQAVKTEAGETALIWARKRGQTDLVQLLRQPAADKDIQPAINRTLPGKEVQRDELRKSLTKSVALLQQSSVEFFRKAGCISCHHQSITSMAIAAARRSGIAVNDQMASQVLNTNLAVFSPHKDALLVANSGLPAPPTVSSYALVSMAAEKFGADRLTEALVCDLATRQHKNGRWHAEGDRPPLSGTDMVSTALTMRALQVYGPPGRRPEFADRIARAREWLVAANAVTLDEKAFRLLGLNWADADRGIIKQAVQTLAAEQRADGGWADLSTLDSDAYATGLALVALRQGGNFQTADPVYQRGVRYLVRTQLEDGSWHVKSRALGFQPYFESGYPHGPDQWISSAGAGWATMALAFALEPQQVARR